MSLWSGSSELRIAFPWLTLFLSVLAIALLLEPENIELLAFDRAAVLEGQGWRLITAHWVHSSISHGVWDIAVFFIVGTWLEKNSRIELFTTLLVGIGCVDLLLLWPDCPLANYCGLSGILFAPLTLLVLRHWSNHCNWINTIPMIFMVLKLIWETLSQSTFVVETAWQAYPAAHWAGVLAGVLYWCGKTRPPVNGQNYQATCDIR